MAKYDISTPEEAKLRKDLEPKTDANSMRLKRYLSMPDLSRTPGSPLEEIVKKAKEVSSLKGFDEIKGSCTIEKAYTFDSSSQSWKKLETAPGPKTNFLFKVKDSCMFGLKEAGLPELPE